MTRREIREEVFKAVFRADFHKEEDLPEQVSLFLQEEEPPITRGSDADYISTKSNDVIKKIPEIDERINSHTEGWTTSRMAKVDLTLIRLAVYEAVYEKIPAGVAINEAVELAKKYGEENSSSFVNGVLARIIG